LKLRSDRSGFSRRLREWREGFFIGLAVDSLLNHLFNRSLEILVVETAICEYLISREEPSTVESVFGMVFHPPDIFSVSDGIVAFAPQEGNPERRSAVQLLNRDLVSASRPASPSRTPLRPSQRGRSALR
jgi:hypothetical protein